MLGHNKLRQPPLNLEIVMCAVHKFMHSDRSLLFILIIDLRGVFNKFPDIFVQTFKIVVDSWKFSMLLL